MVGLPTSGYGVLFSIPSPGTARMTLPQQFVSDIVLLCQRFLTSKHVELAAADALIGKAGRVSHVLPLTRPVVATLYGRSGASRPQPN